MTDKKLVKQKIVDFENYHNGGVNIKVVNLYVGKKTAFADVILSVCDHIERFYNREYPAR